MKKKILVFLSVAIAAASTAFTFGACDLFSTGDNGNNDANTSQGVDGTGNDGSSGGSTDGGNAGGGNTDTGNGNNNSGNTPSGGNTNGGNTNAGNGNTSGGNTSGGSTAHTCSYVFKRTVAADCLNKGYDLYECTCGKSEQRNLKKALGHDYVDTIHKATCTTDWSMTSECSRCHDKKTQTVADSKAPHSYAWTSTTPATCTTDGLKSGNCSVCGAAGTEVIKASGHNYGAYVSDNNATCAKDGTETAVCADCGSKDIKTVVNSRLPHTFGAYVSNNDADCTHKGTKSATCSGCGAKDTVTDTAAGGGSHKWTNSFSGGDNCLSQTVITSRCTVCNEKQIIYGEYGNHDISDGKCKLCGESLQIKSGRFLLEITATSKGVFDFGQVFIEFTFVSVNKGAMVYELAYVQEYFVNGQKQTLRHEIDYPEYGGKGGYDLTLFSVTENKDVTFKSWIDYDVYESDHWLTFVVGGTGGNYTFYQRYYLGI